MFKFIKRILFRTLSLEGYLGAVQRSFFLLYNTGVLRLDSNYDYHYYVRRLIKKGDTVLDIGANLGYYSMLFARWAGPQGRVYSVEPVQIYNRVFNRRARRFKNITLLPYALGLEDKTIEMVTSANNGYISTGLPHVYDPQRDGAIEDAAFRFEVQMKIPSQLFGSLARIDYIKCDIEGFENVVLAELRPIIERHRPTVQVEVWGENQTMLLEMFAQMGYTAHKVVRGKLTTEYGDAQGDFIFMVPPCTRVASATPIET